jgi:hypothetical protein
MNTILRNILAVLAGLVLGSIVNMALVTVGPHIVPIPDGINVNDPKSLAASVHLLEPKHFLFPFLAHALGTLTGAWGAYLLAGTRPATFAYAIGVLFLVGGIVAALMIPAPAWFIASDLVVAYLPMAWIGIRLGRKIRGTPSAAA